MRLGVASVVEDGEESAPHHDADHEAWEDHPEGSVAGVEDRGPEEHKDVHAGLQKRLAAPEEQDLAVAEDDPQPLHAAATKIIFPVPVVFLPRVDHQHSAHHQWEQSHHKRGHGPVAQRLRGNIRNNAWKCSFR